jgi:hypothetical protein
MCDFIRDLEAQQREENKLSPTVTKKMLVTMCQIYDDSHVYKLIHDTLNKEWLLVAKKLDLPRITRAKHDSTLMIVNIINIFDPSITTGSIIDEYQTKYSVNEIICLTSNQYFKSLERAYYDRALLPNYTGYWIYYYADGQPRTEGNYLKGRIAGVWKYFDRNGDRLTDILHEGGKCIPIGHLAWW